MIDLNEFIKINKLDHWLFSAVSGIYLKWINGVCDREQTPHLLDAIKIYNFCNGEVDFEMLLSKTEYRSLLAFKERKGLQDVPLHIDANCKPTLSMREYLKKMNMTQKEFCAITTLSIGTIGGTFRYSNTPGLLYSLIIYYCSNGMINIETFFDKRTRCSLAQYTPELLTKYQLREND